MWEKTIIDRNDLASTIRILRRTVRQDKATGREQEWNQAWCNGHAAGILTALSLIRLDLQYARENR